MGAALLFTWLMSLAPCLDHYTRGNPIARHDANSRSIVTAALETENPKRWAAILDVWGAYESGNAGADAAGGCPGIPIGTLCKRSDGARYCGPYMVSCDRVPVGATLTELARIAIQCFREGARYCPAHPFGIYSGVGCNAWRVVDLRVDVIRREMSVPFPEETE